MDYWGFTGPQWGLLLQQEMLLFAAVFFAIGVADELAVDLAYLWLRFTGCIVTPTVHEADLPRDELSGPAAVFIPAWSEAAVIGHTLAHALTAWPQRNLTIYVGCYRNDRATIEAAQAVAEGDARLRVLAHDIDGPTSKADCLNRLYAALRNDEAALGDRARMVLVHDAEDMVDPAALALVDQAIAQADFVQLPVMALPRASSRWIGNHYSDEFAESHGKTMVVRSVLGGGIPGAGVGCATSRAMLERLANSSPDGEPFARDSLTEDYELGLKIAKLGGKALFLRLRTDDGRLVATRSYFPVDWRSAVRQKTRWMHGIALQSWDRLGWRGGPVQLWMQLRDRRGPFAAMLLALGYTLVVIYSATWLGQLFGLIEPPPLSPSLQIVLIFNVAGLAWRAAARYAFTARDYGLREGLLAIPRMLVSNAIAIMAGWRAFVAYIRALRGAPVTWEKTEHLDHPVHAVAAKAAQ